MVSPNDDKIVKITVSSVMQGVKQIVVEMKDKETVSILKNRIEQETEVLTNRQVLLFKGMELKDNNKTMTDCGINSDAKITMNVKMSTGIVTNPTTTDILLMMPPIFPTNQDQLRKEIKGMHTVHRKPKKMSGIDANASLWTPEKQMENEFTRNRMKTLLRRKKHAPILSGTPVDSEIGSAQTFSPVATPPGELSSPSTVSSHVSSGSEPESDAEVVTEKELKLFFDPPETIEEHKQCRRSMVLAPSSEEELLENLKKFEAERKTKCNTCFKKLSAAQQTMHCKCLRIFCDRHRHPKNHTCVIDYKQDGRNKLKKNNSKVGDGGWRKAKFES